MSCKNGLNLMNMNSNDILKNVVLGTAQFGLNYGISNARGKIKADEAEKILRYCSENNIKYLDTAPAYGDSEKVLGRFDLKKFHIISKVSISLATGFQLKCDEINRSVENSLKKLNVEKLDYLLLHNSDDLRDYDRNQFKEIASNLVASGHINRFGLSIYDEKLVQDTSFNVYQIPGNAMDNRFNGVVSELSSDTVTFMVRSIFLQGLLLLETTSKEFSVIRWKNEIENWNHFVEQSGLSRLEASIFHVLSNFKRCMYIFGVTSSNELVQIVNVLNNYRDFSYFPSLDFTKTDLIDPRKW